MNDQILVGSEQLLRLFSPLLGLVFVLWLVILFEFAKLFDEGACKGLFLFELHLIAVILVEVADEDFVNEQLGVGNSVFQLRVDDFAEVFLDLLPVLLFFVFILHVDERLQLRELILQRLF